jgi:hypothetical protein
MADEGTGLVEIREGVEAELRRLSKSRLKQSARDGREVATELAAAGVLTRKFATLVKRVLSGRGRKADAPDVLALLRIVPNSRG